MMGEPVIGWDLGGAHLKAARLDPQGRIGPVVQVACPLWQGMERLEEALGAVLGQVGAARRHAVTMTGEMADLFPDRAVGGTRLAAAMHDWLSPAELRFYAGAAGFLSANQVAVHTAELASANWLASATRCSSMSGARLSISFRSWPVRWRLGDETISRDWSRGNCSTPVWSAPRSWPSHRRCRSKANRCR